MSGMKRGILTCLYMALFFALLLPAGCTGKNKVEEVKVTADGRIAAPEAPKAAKSEQPTPVEKLYRQAVSLLERSSYQAAAAEFDEVERQYPYSQWATRAQLMAAYAHYRDLKYDESVLALDRFIQLHPGDKNIAYAYYLRALCYYEQISDVRRDQKMTVLALENLQSVVDRYSTSIYARDAQLKMDLTLDHLAGKEMEIGRFYLRAQKYHAAVTRFQRVVENFQTTTHVPEALHRLVETYLALGIPAEARKSAAVLGHNFPDSVWYRDSYRLLKGEIPGEQLEVKPTFYDRTLGKIF